MSFHVGQKVVCVNASMIMHPVRTVPLAENAVYTVRGIWPGKGIFPPHLWLQEIRNAIADHSGLEWAYLASRFRPLVEDRKSVSFTIGADPDSEHWDNRKKTKEKV